MIRRAAILVLPAGPAGALTFTTSPAFAFGGAGGKVDACASP